MNRAITERFVQEQFDENRVRRIAEILAEGLMARLNARRSSRQRRNPVEAAEVGAYLPTTQSDTAAEETDDPP
jgi:hypothetical protein